MNNPDTLFNPLDPEYRSPVGAVPGKTEITFRIKTAHRLMFSNMSLWVMFDGDQSCTEYPMEPEGGDSDYAVYSCRAFIGDLGLYWYHFKGLTPAGIRFIGRSQGSAALQDTPISWQLTVYDESFTTPDWIKGGVFYHIFVDRFCHEGEYVTKPGALLRTDWGGTPRYGPDEQGIVRNNDFFGGNLRGVIEKLPYLRALGVTCLYLSPVFEAYSNHKYDTGNYLHIDPMFGSDNDFRELCDQAYQYGMRVICDGVFNHTGSDSLYFNKYGDYPSIGAYQSQDSPYYNWYTFIQYPDVYESWWGIDTLPAINESDPGYIEFINGENGVVRRWLRAGASGWRLDVVDELPDSFVEKLNAAAKAENNDALIIGEVWEDASRKVAYDQRRQYFQGKELDSVMNYPFKDAIIAFVRYKNAELLGETVNMILEHYPMCVVHCLMNLLGTHDTPRILTELGGARHHELTRDQQAVERMRPHELFAAVRLMRMAALIQMTLPGVPCIYYGDEVGMEGYGDPFNRRCFPWNKIDRELLAWYRFLTGLRKEYEVFKDGACHVFWSKNEVFVFERQKSRKSILVAANRSGNRFTMPVQGVYEDLITGVEYKNRIIIPADNYIICRRTDE